MRCKKNITCNIRNITCSLQNIISFYRNLIGHFTDKEKILTLRFRNITLSLLILILSLVNITLCFSNYNNTSALDYSSNVGIGFTFNPTLSINISPSDLIIDNLTPGTVSDSNIINVSVATNAAYGYTLSATVGDSTHDNSNLTHTNSTNIFSSIATDADLPSLTTDNTWGYNTSLDGGSTWSNYNGLSNSSNTTLLDKDSNISSSIDFRIGAKASPVQPSGTYTNTITFTAVTKPTPITLSEAYASEGKTMVNGYYTMQDMTSTICDKTEAIGAQLQVLDIRDYKLYWISKLADNHCWMTQNLDLDLSHNKPLTSEDTDLNITYSIPNNHQEYQNGYTTESGIIYYTPINNTIDFAGTTVTGWNNTFTIPYSANKTDSTETGHTSLGNYYNWTAAIVSNNSAALISSTYENISQNPQNSICAKGWRLPTISNDSANAPYSTNEFARLSFLYGNKPNAWLQQPLYYVKTGIAATNITGNYDAYWSSTIAGSYSAYNLYLSNLVNASDNSRKMFGWPVRCLAK